MTAETDLYDALRNDVDVTAVVGTRIYPDEQPEDDPKPAIVYTQVSAEAFQTVHGTTVGMTTTFAVICMADSRTQAIDLGTKASAALQGNYIRFVDRNDDFDPESETHLTVLTVEHDE